MSGSLAGYNPLEELDHTPPPQPQDLQHGSGGYKSKLTAMSAAVGGAACRYRECLKNHAASVGGNVTDGCGEFMPSGEEGTLEALKCAACNCHRNFHRKERGSGDGVMIVHPLQLPPPPALPPSMMTSPSSLNHHHHNQHQHHHRSAQWAAAPPSSLAAPQPVKMTAYGSTATDSSSEEMNFNVYQSQTPYAVAKKRFRTKFSSGQKEKMMDFAEKLGWRIPREDDSQLQSFCAEVGVKRQVFKVWMHNNKNSATKKNSSASDHHHHQDDEDHHHQTPVGIAGM
ncbi:unnamed protein product [Cuscuta europaea]|uniref:ZF-HD dimerization-type domain-containing protein n=1 Tax=Cuscuta europaea TaxID=41803 RepID=A0A9P0YH14_CUSEU|nr:unnamed protein product [Cuscuta europaea]